VRGSLPCFARVDHVPDSEDSGDKSWACAAADSTGSWGAVDASPGCGPAANPPLPWPWRALASHRTVEENSTNGAGLGSRPDSLPDFSDSLAMGGRTRPPPVALGKRAQYSAPVFHPLCIVAWVRQRPGESVRAFGAGGATPNRAEFHAGEHASAELPPPRGRLASADNPW
jgi:hypothetical protein